MNRIKQQTKQPFMSVRLGVVLALLFAMHAIAGPEIPGAPQTKPIAIVGATIHPVAKPDISEGTIVFDGGQITAIGTDVTIPENAEVIEAAGRHVYPGLFNTDGVLGLIEINAVRATDDRGEVGQLNMNVRTEKAINPDSELIPVTRSGGVLFNLTAPVRGLIAGTSAVLQLDGWTTEDMTLKAAAGMHIAWPSINEHPHHDEHDHDAEDRQADSLRQLDDVFHRAEVYRDARSGNPDQPIDLRWEAMLPVLRGDVPIVAAAHSASQMQSAIAFANRRKLKLIIYGGNDAEEVAPLLRGQNVPVIISGVYRLPRRRDAPYDHAYTLPERLRKAGVPFCIAGSARFDASNIRNLPYHAAMATAFGLPKQEALKAITLSPAKILRVDDKVGSLEAGKHASLIVTDGDIFDTATNVTHAFVQGRAVDLDDRHKRLYRKYEARQKQ